MRAGSSNSKPTQLGARLLPVREERRRDISWRGVGDHGHVDLDRDTEVVMLATPLVGDQPPSPNGRPRLLYDRRRGDLDGRLGTVLATSHTSAPSNSPRAVRARTVRALRVAALCARGASPTSGSRRSSSSPRNNSVPRPSRRLRRGHPCVAGHPPTRPRRAQFRNDRDHPSCGPWSRC